MRFVSLLALFTVACNDYDLQTTGDKRNEADTDTGEFVPTTDTSDTSVDTDTGSVVIDDSGPEDSAPPDDPEVATESMYLNTGSALYSYDPATNTASIIGNFSSGGSRVTDMTDIAIDLNGYMYGVAYDVLYQITPATADVRRVAALDAQYNALTFVSTGALVGAAANQVVSIDTSTGRTTRIGGSGYTSSGDIIGLPDGYLYWSTEGGGSDDLVRIDPNSGAATKLGSIGESGVYALGFADGVLYGFLSAGEVFQISSTSGRGSGNQRLSGTWWGATTNPVLW